ncbi:hypothetical protein R3P38DRAFT_2753287 [Favolaschia claudopus]|uniref:HNH nuclease domain-containing protein n=1 Tax=Favolaschia claudopus TaxID=2862362 RepID=A0AAV9Z2E6_9AGAR
MVDHDHGHVLSAKSRDLERDTFIFIHLQTKSKLFMGFNQKVTPVTSALIHRWVAFLIGDRGPEDPFWLCPVTLASAGIMAYRMVATGPGIDPQSSEPLPPGNYGWYFDSACTNWGLPELANSPFRLTTIAGRLEDMKEYLSEDFERHEFPPSANATAATARDQGRCRFTGATENTTVAWIIPPAVSWETQDFGRQSDWDQTPFVVTENLITMQAILKPHFYGNNFTVDVDDNRRIIILRSMGDAQRLLPSHLPDHILPTPEVDHYLRLHCRYSLNAMLLCGDVSETYSNGLILETMHNLGVNHVGYHDYHESDMVPFTDPGWTTELGREILADVMRQRLALSRYRADSDEETGADAGAGAYSDDDDDELV